MHSKSDNKEVTINDKADKIINFLNHFWIDDLGKLMKGTEFVFDYVHLLYDKFYKIYLNCGGYIDSPDWIKNKKATINSINKKT